MAGTTITHEPLRPVVINEHGEALIGYSPESGQQTIQHEDSLFIHSRHNGDCIGLIKHFDISLTHAVIYCPLCGLRVPIPAHLKTYHDIRRYFPEHNYPATASVNHYPETAPLLHTPQENADGELVPHRPTRTKEEDAYEESYRPSAYER